MKNKCFIICSIIFLSFLVIQSQAQPLPPGGGHGQLGDQPPGGGAPIGSGLILSISLSMGFLTYKYLIHKNESPQYES